MHSLSGRKRSVSRGVMGGSQALPEGVRARVRATSNAVLRVSIASALSATTGWLTVIGAD